MKNKGYITISVITTIGVAVFGWLFIGINKTSDRVDAAMQIGNEAKIQTAGLVEKVEAIKENMDGLKTDINKFKENVDNKMDNINVKLNLILQKK